MMKSFQSNYRWCKLDEIFSFVRFRTFRVLREGEFSRSQRIEIVVLRERGTEEGGGGARGERELLALLEREKLVVSSSSFFAWLELVLPRPSSSFSEGH